MIDYLYRFPDEATARTVLADYFDQDNGWKLAGPGFALDPVGVLADVDASDPQNPISTTLPGWHINLRVSDARWNPAVDYTVTPAFQRRGWL